MGKNMTISIADDFSAFPAGRISADGPNSGERFREELLRDRISDAIANDSKVLVVLSGIQSCGSSFLEEAFGGLVRHRNFTKEQLGKYLEIVGGEPHLIRIKDAIERHIRKAEPA